MSSKPYRPSNGTEGADFQDAFCCRCERDAKFSEDTPELGCQILADTFAYDIDHPKYPKEWIIGKDGFGCCAAFVDAGEEIPYRCDKTIDLFDRGGL
jgi:hypothetical protein